MAKEWAKSFYTSDAWRCVRREVLRRDMFTCAMCFGRAEEVHHKQELTPKNIQDVNISLNPDNLISLCHKCHTAITKNSKQLEYYFDEFGQYVPRVNTPPGGHPEMDGRPNREGPQRKTR